MRIETRLECDGVRLRPLQVSDAHDMFHLIDEDSWAGMSTPLPQDAEIVEKELCTIIEHPGVLAFAVELGGRFVGRTTIYDLVPQLRCEIGNTFLGPSARGNGVNVRCKYALLTYCFENLGLHRVALRCDSRNHRSHRAIAGLGARYEGTLRGFRYGADGSIVDLDYFSILASEWPAVKEGLESRIWGKVHHLSD